MLTRSAKRTCKFSFQTLSSIPWSYWPMSPTPSEGRLGEITEMLDWRHGDFCCIQEIKQRGSSAKFLTGKEHRYKMFWLGNIDGVGDEGIQLAEK